MNHIKFVVFDYDGVFTNGKCFFSKNNIYKYYDIKDGMGLAMLKKNNIKIGLISSYYSNKEIFLNNSEIEYDIKTISEHLKFDYIHIGLGNKLQILNTWIEKLNYEYSEIAYIGDDINDLEILDVVGFSSCPADAINECKNTVDYICEKKGGEGCVREFIDKIINKDLIEDKYTKIINEIKTETKYQLNNLISGDIDKIIELIIGTNGNIYLSGIGKSGIISNYFCSLLKSIGIRSFFIDPINGLHGDIGVINSTDLLIFFSKSGNTHELNVFIKYIKNKQCKIIGICCDNNNNFVNNCDYTFVLPFKQELSGEINKIPTNSSTIQLLFSNIVISILKNNVTPSSYKENHPSGNIGVNLKQIKDLLIYDYPVLVIKEDLKIYDILFEMTKYKIGCCFFSGQEGNFIGLLTDGDIRKMIVEDENKKFIKISDINENYIYETDLNKYINLCKKNIFIPMITDNKIAGIFRQ